MKKIKIFAGVFILVFGVALFSCSNEDNLENKEKINNTEEKQVFIKEGLTSDGVIGKQFTSFLGEYTTRSNSSTNNWDLDNIVEFSSPEESLYCYMLIDKENSEYILGGCGTTKDLITTFYTFYKNGELYTLKDSFNEPVADFKLDLDNKQIILVESYIPETRASASEWCGAGMGAAAMVSTTFLAPVTLGASIGFFACWTVITVLMCR